jgi:rfaE bifunctional protein nucleotidyltransferase chain/domain
MLNIDSLDSFISKKIISFNTAVKLVSKLKKDGKKVGLCHGGFDLLHPGHIKHFEAAKNLCDILVVSITSDKYVSVRKNTGRPIFTDKLRAYSVASISFVDHVFICDFKLATDAIHLLKPSYYIKGPDFINKTTPGIIAERKTIEEVGGEIKYTKDPTLSTTKIIDYIKEKVNREKILLIIDRDGTLIQDQNFLGKNYTWKNKIKFNKNVVDFISYIQTKTNSTSIVLTNQAGVARGYFDCDRVEEINSYVAKTLRKNNIIIHNWQYCPFVDSEYAKSSKLYFKKEFIRKKTKRKPCTDMIFDALKNINMKLDDFSKIIVIGDRHEDETLAKNINSHFIDVKGKSYNELILNFESFLKDKK